MFSKHVCRGWGFENSWGQGVLIWELHRNRVAEVLIQQIEFEIYSGTEYTELKKMGQLIPWSYSQLEIFCGLSVHNGCRDLWTPFEVYFKNLYVCIIYYLSDFSKVSITLNRFKIHWPKLSHSILTWYKKERL